MTLIVGRFMVFSDGATYLPVNTAIIGTVGYFAYKNWDAPRWDRRMVSAVSVGIIALWSGEG